MSLEQDFLDAIEVNSPDEIRDCISRGFDVDKPLGNVGIPAPKEGWTAINVLIMMYLRSNRFSECLQVLLDAGAQYPHPEVIAILMGDDAGLKKHLDKKPSLVQERYNLPSPFTSLDGATLLHICAEFNQTDCADLLISAGADPDVQAGFDENGMGGHTPIFHTVNTHKNYAYPMLELLLQRGASTEIYLKGLIWGKHHEWETYIPEINPISYAMMGNLSQFQRSSTDIARNIELMQEYKYGLKYTIKNVPNAYVVRKHSGT